jgi:hypothetical protein
MLVAYFRTFASQVDFALTFLRDANGMPRCTFAPGLYEIDFYEKVAHSIQEDP